MRVRRARLSLLGVAALCGIGSIAALAWGIIWPVSTVALQDRPANAVTGTASAETTKATTPALESLVTHCNKPLQRPLRQDTVAAAQAAAAQQAAKNGGPFSAMLVGTMIEEGFSRAMFSVPPATIELKAVGELIGIPPVTAEIVKIEPNQVLVRYQGQLVTLRLKGADEG